MSILFINKTLRLNNLTIFTGKSYVLLNSVQEQWSIKNTVNLNGCSFQQVCGKTWVGFCFNTRKWIGVRDNRKSIGSSKKKVLGIFKIALCLKDLHVFMWQLLEILTVFYTLTLKQIFWKIKSFFKKLEHTFLVERAKIENASFSYKTAISETNVWTNRIVSTKWTYHKEWIFASN